ncbi:sucrose-binding protein-like [Hibiscus syriacus]|uniref:Sucrose-binding protein-like n=1 Tax=Hibiscus syriacus TaxID=106335 RepID=A0A6A2YHJ7_HIBSY|nr:sucrose-binding protein-like [Hibiscus syriacus]
MEKQPNTDLRFPPGFRFHPSDEELIIHYLQNKVASRPLPASSSRQEVSQRRKTEPSGVKTEWTMNEYRLLDTMVKPPRFRGSMRLDDWVLCRVRRKSNISKNTSKVQDGTDTKFTRSMQPEFAHDGGDMMSDCLNQDCQVLALILSGQGLPPIEANPTATFQGSNNFISFGKEDYEKRNENFPPIKMFPRNYINFQDPTDSVIEFHDHNSIRPSHIYA